VGASHPDGLPVEVFASGDAQWMSLQFGRPGEVELPRVRITSVPYALKARDADTLGGLPASAYLLAPTGHTGRDEARRVAGASADISSLATTDSAVASNSLLTGTTNFLAKYVNSTNLGNSAIFENGGKVGIGTTTPFDRLHLRFNDPGGSVTGLAVQNLGNTATSYSGMLFYDRSVRWGSSRASTTSRTNTGSTILPPTGPSTSCWAVCHV
jgi:hypothetical protein